MLADKCSEQHDVLDSKPPKSPHSTISHRSGWAEDFLDPLGSGSFCARADIPPSHTPPALDASGSGNTLTNMCFATYTGDVSLLFCSLPFACLVMKQHLCAESLPTLIE